MITIDGHFGEGGGQILRTSLALSMVTGKPFRITNIRAGRKKPGLLRQHLTAVQAAARVGNAHLQGAVLGSQELIFEPQGITPGTYRFSVGTAGSATLVFQTILPALAVASGPSEVVLEGGTHNPYAPPFDFLRDAFAPVVSRMGWHIELSIQRWGFFPAGGGCFTARIEPTERTLPLRILERGPVIPSMTAISAKIPEDVRVDEANTVARYLGWRNAQIQTQEVASPGPGNAVMVKLESPQLTEVFTGFGEQRVSRKKVVRNIVELVGRYLAADDVPVGRFLADQLLIPCAMGGAGEYRTLEPTEHTRTNAVVIGKFLDVGIDMTQNADDDWLIKVRK